MEHQPGTPKELTMDKLSWSSTFTPENKKAAPQTPIRLWQAACCTQSELQLCLNSPGPQELSCDSRHLSR